MNENTEGQAKLRSLWELLSEESAEHAAAEEASHREHEEAVLALEATHPGLKFARYRKADGSLAVPAWGVCPEQAFGTLEGQPFYFRERGGVATLRVWGAAAVPPPSDPAAPQEQWPVPTYNFLPLLASSAADTEVSVLPSGVPLFKQLLEALQPVRVEDSWVTQEAAWAASKGLPQGREVGELFTQEHPGWTVVSREEAFLKLPEVYLSSSEGLTLALRWKTGQRLALSLIPSGVEHPLLAQPALHRVVDLGGDTPSAPTAESLLAAAGEVSFDPEGDAYQPTSFWKFPEEPEARLEELRELSESFKRSL